MYTFANIIYVDMPGINAIVEIFGVDVDVQDYRIAEIILDDRSFEVTSPGRFALSVGWQEATVNAIVRLEAI